MRNLPIAVDSPFASLCLGKGEEAMFACHEWQHGSHIDSLPKEPPQDYFSEHYPPAVYNKVSKL